MGHSQSLFLYFRLFNTLEIKQMFNIKICQGLDSNCGPLGSEATTLPTEPQHLQLTQEEFAMNRPLQLSTKFHFLQRFISVSFSRKWRILRQKMKNKGMDNPGLFFVFFFANSL